MKPEHPDTSMCDQSDIPANHHEANTSAVSKEGKTDRRRQNLQPGAGEYFPPMEFVIESSNQHWDVGGVI